MYKYELYLGYETTFGGFSHLGTIEHNYSLNKGDTVIVSEELMGKINDIKNLKGKSIPMGRSTYKVASVHQFIGKPEINAAIYLVMDKDYKG